MNNISDHDSDYSDNEFVPDEKSISDIERSNVEIDMGEFYFQIKDHIGSCVAFLDKLTCSNDLVDLVYNEFEYNYDNFNATKFKQWKTNYHSELQNTFEMLENTKWGNTVDFNTWCTFSYCFSSKFIPSLVSESLV